MRQEVASHVVLSGTTPVYSQAVPTNGLNGVYLDMTVLAAYVVSTTASDTISASVEQSADMQNWSAVALTAAVTGTSAAFPAFDSAQTGGTSSAISGKYVRLKFIAGVTGTRACIDAGVNLFSFAT